MEHNNLMKQIVRIDTGYSVSIIINTKGKGVPSYLLNYLSVQGKETKRLFEIPALFDITPSIEGIRASHPNIQKTDTLIQVIATINLPLPEEDYTRYMEDYLREVILPFIIGCGFSVVTWQFRFNTPLEFHQKRYLEGVHSVVIKEAKMPTCLRVIFSDMFQMSSREIDRAEILFEQTGCYRISNCIKEEQVEEFKRNFGVIGINFELE